MKFISTFVCIAVSVVPIIADVVCRIVSLSGGGSHGAFEAGVVNRLMDNPGWKPWDVHLGVSAGALGIVGMLKSDYQENMQKVKKVWSEIDTGDVLEPLKSSNSFSGNQKIYKIISDTYDQLTGSPSDGIFQVGVVDLVSGEFISLPLQTSSPNLTYVLASTSIPIVFPPIGIRWKHKDITAVDGGLQKNEFYLSGLEYCPPGSTSFEMDLIFANYETDTYQPTSWNLWSISTRSIELVMNDFNDMYFKDVSECSGLKGLNLEMRIHGPSSPLDVKGLDFDHGALLWYLGYNNMTTTTYYC
jgi:hypothetical protein